ncbi:MAG: VPS10 domain-containing protein [Ignavibacteria bacterium]
MKNFLTLSMLVFFIISFNDVKAQQWFDTNLPATATFKDIKQSFNDYWKGKQIERGKGYKQFKRWEWYWESRLMPNGEFPSPTITMDESRRYFEMHASKQSPGTLSSDDWEFAGPTTSPGKYHGLGRLNCVAFHPTDKQVFWVGSPSGGLWKTTDGGSTWSTKTDDLPVLGISDIAIDPTNTNIMYIATGDGDGGGGLLLPHGDTKSIGVLKSTNGGSTWSATGLSSTVSELKLIRRLLIHPNNPQRLLAATSDGIWMTSNGGKTWEKTQTGRFIDLEFHPTDPSIVYASTYAVLFSSDTVSQIYRSTNTGSSWTSVATLDGVRRIDMAVSKHSPNVVQGLCADLYGGLSGIWTSTDNGASFSETFTGTESTNLLNTSYNASGIGGQGFYDLALAINPFDVNEIWVGGINTWKSNDGAKTWKLNTMWVQDSSINPNQVQVVHADKHFMMYHPLDSGVMFQCNDGGLYKTTNAGADWIDLSNGLGISQIYRIGVAQTTDLVIAGLQDNGSKGRVEDVWIELPGGGDGMNCIIDYSDHNFLYWSVQYGVIYRFDGLKPSTEAISINIPDGQIENTSPTGAWITPFVLHPRNPKVLYAGYHRIFKTTDRGDSWTAISPVLNSDLLQYLAISPSDENTIYAATPDSLYGTTDGGQNWKYISIGIPSAHISNITVDPLNSKRIYITISGYLEGKKVFISPDAGDNWYNYSGSLPNVPVNCIVYQEGSNEGLYIGTDIGVFYTDASMTDWIPYQNGLPNVIVNDLEISYRDKTLWAGTYGRGLWATELNMTAVGIVMQNGNSNIDVFPNPNSGTFTIEVPDTKMYDITVHNVHGELVFEQHQLPSSQNVIDLTHLNSGVYIVRLTIDDRTISRKMIINK